MNNKEIGLRIHARRKALGLTQQEVADSLNVGKALVYKWEYGQIGLNKKRHVPVAQILGVSVEYLLFGTNKFQDEKQSDQTITSTYKWRVFIENYRRCTENDKKVIFNVANIMSVAE